MDIDAARLRDDVETNATFGAVDAEDGRGRTVLTGSAADRRAREYLLGRLEDAGLDVRVDAVGNVVGRWTPPGCDPEAAPVAFGSHLDSVPRGGIFDGPLGVYGALEGVRAMQGSDVSPARPVDVVCFTEEEGARFGVGTLGSSVATGHRGTADALALEDDDGVTLRERLEGIGFDGDDEVDASEWDAWMELHIEQGTRLTAAGASVGVVESITGITNCEVTVRGEADHAGSTPMYERADALTAASEFVLDLERAAEELATTSEAAVGTAGKGSIAPNARNIVPERVQYQLDIRDVDRGKMDRLVERCRTSLARIERTRGVGTSLTRYRDSPPSRMAERCLTAADDAATARGVESIRLYSAAMHDTANLADVTDAGLLFAPSVDGVSHSPREWTDWDDCATASGVLAEAVRALAST
ncbi:M20 family metallo-hydrolase [Haloplanus natans]|uniref:M20 family metallo-hydrolase n=1 Tax=Haloplanus natans TaxID=376171 RepID=UPI000677C1F5|nr:M20 family metallo-hydrolase [Haloplanus natans]